MYVRTYLRIYFSCVGLLIFPLSLSLSKSHPRTPVKTFQGGRKSQPFTTRIYMWRGTRDDSEQKKKKKEEGKAHL